MMKGLTYNDTKGAKALVEDLAKKTFRTSPEIQAIIKNNSNQPTEDELDKVLDIQASFLPIKQRMNITRCWNLYFINDPGYEDEEYRLLRKKMRACIFKILTFDSLDGWVSNQTAPETQLERWILQMKSKTKMEHNRQMHTEGERTPLETGEEATGAKEEDTH
ncbi:hypothetical protein C0993_009012 [Termitomyces sp. T159_Od127]|nr:hypothetical protein C0993_009012 [Termitomyces sp. T159_Od127]